MEDSKPEFLQLEDKIDLHRKGWRVQSVFLTVIFLFILAAGLGLFGDGILGQKILGEKNSGLWLEYDRFGRNQAPGKMEVHVMGSGNSPVQLIIPSSYLKNFHIEAITPAPNAIATHHDQVAYTFNAEGPFTVVFRMKPDAIGKVQGSILVNNKNFVLNHFIYP